MFNILTLNKIADAGIKNLPTDLFNISSEVKNPDGILIRSFDMHKMELEDKLVAVGRAGAGTNNIPVDKCSEKGIVVFNTPGANANAVKELVIASILLSSRKIIEGINWVTSLTDDVVKSVEKGKSQFVGPEIYGKKIGVIGLGAIGILVANTCSRLGMNVVGYDPYISVDSAWKLSRGVQKADAIEEIFNECDFITLHLPLLEGTRNMINEESLKLVKQGTVIINLARGELVDNEAIKDAVKREVVAKYVTDFPKEEIIGIKNIITIPHLGASTPESEENCAVMASQEIKEYIEFGNIRNSVNFPDCEMAYTNKPRICVIHKNVPKMVASLTSIVSDEGLNIDNLLNKSKGEFAYTMMDIDGDVTEKMSDEIKKINGVIKIRIL